MLRALRPPFEANPTLRYRFAGGVVYQKALRKYLTDYENAHRVTVLGFGDTVEDEFASAEGFLYLRFLNYQLTLVLVSQAAGLPVIGGDAVGVPEPVGVDVDNCTTVAVGVRDTIKQLL